MRGRSEHRYVMCPQDGFMIDEVRWIIDMGIMETSWKETFGHPAGVVLILDGFSNSKG